MTIIHKHTHEHHHHIHVDGIPKISLDVKLEIKQPITPQEEKEIIKRIEKIIQQLKATV